jgi:hypothetical protein
MDEQARALSDPSSLTTQQLWRETAALKELLESHIKALEKSVTVAHEDLVRVPTDIDKQIGTLKELLESKIECAESERELVRTVIETRLNGNDQAIELLQATADKFPARMDEKIESLRGVHNEKFESIQKQFIERDVRTDQTSRDSKVAVDAALQAAKEAVAEQNRSSALAIAKSEASTVKQIDQMGLLIQTGNKAVDDKFDDIKERLTRIEGKGEGGHQAWGYVIGAFGLLLTLVTLFFAFRRA